IRVFEELRGLGYEGSYDAVRRYAKRWRIERGAATAEAYVPLSFAPGEAYQFDWSHEVVLINGTTVTVKLAHVRLCHSRMLFVRAYPRETQEMVFDAHNRAFAFFKGTCTRGIYDNMKTAVETVFIGKDHKYSVSARAVGRAVEIQAYAEHPHPPGRRDRRRSFAPPRSRRDDLRLLALRAGTGQEARRSQERSPVQGLAAAGQSGARAAEA